ncbi:hypothetical protein COX86_03065 [Candidatus Micrarchaeota archaeon CG_4_10_14_0_2_um_filter_60_11]|nr:MAG: hypothetical protein AUJ16_00270 [Candidatus Micrarchaeota archaeon CG1_02_60_51]PIN96651.1 MAG: hypothetical protein COU39_00225 [Candidatus Micrarchaeota archaeon CG10_big_fil_rev_8_21_14_0_10_60_32]PIO02421.1 MAG: hypothetical protein COT58_00270 [Candidatus Micrarchaeota archaeon CG09_land_8_20_14_0_10_60_16]PIY91208.1 MAG: hypothetical protein COY71_04395 [Candidatus Micrarchaeota archaeon CG_4_10_14_0_8_um_filter_60_7]PIZ90797.1 MAG: hypothetical protein COX86_03065 [Candidatus Mi
MGGYRSGLAQAARLERAEGEALGSLSTFKKLGIASQHLGVMSSLDKLAKLDLHKDLVAYLEDNIHNMHGRTFSNAPFSSPLDKFLIPHITQHERVLSELETSGLSQEQKAAIEGLVSRRLGLLREIKGVEIRTQSLIVYLREKRVLNH